MTPERAAILLVLTASAALLVVGTPCPANWRQAGATCYLTNTSSTLSWAGADAFCQEYGGALVSIANRSKLLDVVDIIRGQAAPPPPVSAPVRRSGRVRRPPSRLVVNPSGASYDSSAVHVSGPSAETEPGSAAPAGPPSDTGTEQLIWWINIRKPFGSDSANEGFQFDNFGEEKRQPDDDTSSSDSSAQNQCVYLAADDGLWDWHPCDRKINYICERPAERVNIDLVTPDRRRPEPAWFAAHAVRLEAALAAREFNSSTTDDKGTHQPSKVTMTPITPSPTTPVTEPPSSASALPPGAPTPAGTSSPCGDSSWLAVADRCHHLYLEAKTWDAASVTCTQQGGELSSFSSKAEQDTFQQLYGFNTGLIWIDGRKHRHGLLTGDWIFGRGGYTSWDQGEPSAAGNCAAMALHTGKWSAQNCSLPRAFACSRVPGATPMPNTPAPPSTSAPPSEAHPECGEEGWWRYGDTCMRLVRDQLVSWHAAQQTCRGLSAMLVKINSYHKKEFIVNKLNNMDQVWIGLSKWNVAGGKFRWSDGSRVTRPFWAGGHDENAEMSSCVRMDGGHGYWTSANCNLPEPFLCEKPWVGQVTWPPAPRPPLRSTCPDQWRPYGSDRCLKLFPELASWETARQRCRGQGEGADLITVPSAVHQAFLTSSVRESTNNVWLGLTYEKQERSYLTWVDEAAVTFTAWSAGQPSPPCPSCVRACGVADGGRSREPASWRTVDCGTLFSFVCQRPATPNNTISTRIQLCESPFQEYTAVEDACYYVNHNEMTWSDAANKCQSDGSSLAYVGDAFDNAELVKLLYRDGRDQYWLGLSDTQRYGIMEWTSPWPHTPTFQRWNQTQRRAGVRSSCAVLRPATGLWWYQSCQQQRPFVCMRAPDRVNLALSSQGCPDNTTWLGSRRRCYKLYNEASSNVNWDDARTECENLGYRLAQVSSMRDFLAVRQALNGLTYNAWIGLHYDTSANGYRWADGSVANFSGWHQGEPRSDACAQVTVPGGHWKSTPCSYTMPFVCMTDKVSAPAVRTAGQTGGGGSGAAVAVVCLLLVLAAAALAGVWYARRRRVAWLPAWLSPRPSTHHSVDNLAYHHHNDSLAPHRGEGGSLENGDIDHHAANRWGSQEQLVVDGGL